ncbi:MAG: thioredoxin family protein [Paramuribaculum sp.]|nr:thioredoxin family protein [Paramuribaculum sp.]
MKVIKFLFASAVIALASCNSASKTEAAAESEAEEQTTEVEAAELTPAETTGEDAVIVLDKGATDLPVADVPVIVDFSATWCGPCQKFKPTFHQVAEEYKGKALFVSVDVDDCPELAQKYNVTSIPLVVAVVPNGADLEDLLGYQTYEDFKAYVEKAIAEK